MCEVQLLGRGHGRRVGACKHLMAGARLVDRGSVDTEAGMDKETSAGNKQEGGRGSPMLAKWGGLRAS